jgi:hypothetical protein
MPQVFRAMRKDRDDLPTLARLATALGVRIGIDIDIDSQNNAIANNKGMSVSPAWRQLPIFRIPKRLDPRGQGSNNTYCFKRGTGSFLQGAFAPGLELLPDSPTHGVVRPTQLVQLSQYENDLAATRAEWQIDET